MAVSLTINGITYSYPETGDEQWGDNATDWATAVTSGMLQKAGGTFTLTADVDFGASFGLKAAYLKSRGSNIAQSGLVRLENAATGVVWRNAANGADLPLTVDSSNRLTYNGIPISSSSGIVPPSAGGTGIANNNASTLTISGSFATTLTISNTTSLTLPTTGTLATLAGSENLTNKTITSATLSGTFPGAVTFSGSTLAFSGNTPSSSSITGTIVVTGGLGVSGSIYAGATGVFAGILNAADTTDSSSTGTGSLVSLGGLGIAKKAYFGDLIHLPNDKGVLWRNNAGSNDITLKVTTSDQLSYGGTAFLSSAGVLLAAGFPALTGDVTTSAGSLATTLAATTNATLATLTRTAGVSIKGTNTNDSASAGYVGEYVSSSATAVAAPTTGQWGDVVSISLTSGDWDVSVNMWVGSFSAANTTQLGYGVSQTSGNSASGLSSGVNLFYYAANPFTPVTDAPFMLPRYRVSLSGSATLYLKLQILYTGGSPTANATLSARRMR